VRAALRSQAQASSSPFAGGTAMAGRADKGRSSQVPPEETSCPACWRAPRPVKFLAHAYATCAVMRELDTIMFVRDSCSKQLDSDRLAAYVPVVIFSFKEIKTESLVKEN